MSSRTRTWKLDSSTTRFCTHIWVTIQTTTAKLRITYQRSMESTAESALLVGTSTDVFDDK